MQTIVTRVLCDHCLTLPVAVPGTEAHPYLRIEGDFIKQQNDKFDRKVRCTMCQTLWLHRTGKWENCEGYRLAP